MKNGKKNTPEATLPNSDYTGKIIGLCANVEDGSLNCTLSMKKGHKRTFPVKGRDSIQTSTLFSLASAAFLAGEKVHVEFAENSTSAALSISKIRIGQKEKQSPEVSLS